jgi:hypothetical protein
VNDPLPPAAVKDCPPELREYVHPEGEPAWFTVILTPAIEIVAFWAAPEFAATTSVTVAGPVPEVAPETVIQVGSPVTPHAQPGARLGGLLKYYGRAA